MSRLLWDTIVVNARIHSLDREGEQFSAMAVRDGRIDAVFPAAPAPTLVRGARAVVDCGGRTVLPGLIDAHVHFLPASVLRVAALCVSDLRPPLKGMTLAEVAEKLRAYAAQLPTNRPVVCFNYVIDAVAEKRLPTRSELDAWLPGRQSVVMSMDGHSSSYSSSALHRLGLAAGHADGVLEGESHELSMGKVNALIASSVSIGMLCRGIQSTVNESLKQGIVCLHCLEGFEDSAHDPSLWMLSRCGGILPVDLRLYVQYRDPRRVAPFRRFLKRPRIGGCFGWAMDGSVSSGTAAFDEPYRSDPSNSGKLYFTPQEAEDLVARADAAGCQIACHAIGTRAIETLLSAYERVLDGTQGNPRRHRIDHFEFPTAGQVERAVRRGLAIVAQPGFAWMDEKYISAYRRQLAPAQYERQLPLRSLTEAGAVVAGSSDYPAGLLSPWVQMQGMVEHPLPSQSIGLYQALRTYSWNAAWVTGEEGERGTLLPGKKADFIVMENDPFGLPTGGLHEAAVRETWINGRKAGQMSLSTAGFLMRTLAGRHRKI
jgi:predicted amidohydrolase YtcJ